MFIYINIFEHILIFNFNCTGFFWLFFLSPINLFFISVQQQALQTSVHQPMSQFGLGLGLGAPLQAGGLSAQNFALQQNIGLAGQNLALNQNLMGQNLGQDLGELCDYESTIYIHFIFYSKVEKIYYWVSSGSEKAMCLCNFIRTLLVPFIIFARIIECLDTRLFLFILDCDAEEAILYLITCK